MDLLLGDHVVEHVGVGAGRVHHGPGLEGPDGGDHLPVAVLQLLEVGHLGVAQELGAVHGRVLRIGHGQLIGTNDAAGANQQSFLSFAAYVGLPLSELCFVDDPKLAPDAVLPALIQQLFQRRVAFLTKGNHQRGVPLYGHVQLLVELIEHGVAQDVELGLKGAGFRIVAAVDDGGVGLALPVADIVGLFQQQHLGLAAHELSGCAATHHTAADDDHIVNLVHLFSPFTYLLWPSQRRT